MKINAIISAVAALSEQHAIHGHISLASVDMLLGQLRVYGDQEIDARVIGQLLQIQARLIYDLRSLATDHDQIGRLDEIESIRNALSVYVG